MGVLPGTVQEVPDFEITAVPVRIRFEYLDGGEKTPCGFPFADTVYDGHLRKFPFFVPHAKLVSALTSRSKSKGLPAYVVTSPKTLCAKHGQAEGHSFRFGRKPDGNNSSCCGEHHNHSRIHRHHTSRGGAGRADG